MPRTNKIYLGDCVEVMKNFSDNSIDICITDIPYGIDYDKWDTLHNNTNSALGGASPHQQNDTSFKRRGKPINGWSEADKKRPYEYEQWCGKWAKELFRITKEASPILIFSSRRLLHRVCTALEDNGFMIRDILVWEKDRCNPKAQRVSKVLNRRGIYNETFNDYRIGNLAPFYEPIIFAMKPYKRTVTDCVINNGLGGFIGKDGSIPSNIIKCSINKRNLYHETEKPVELIETLIELFSISEQHVILDFTMGSGTTGVAAAKQNRGFIGIELDEKHFAVAAQRLQAVGELLQITTEPPATT